MNILKAILRAFLLFLAFGAPTAAMAASGIAPMNAADFRIALQKLRVTGTVMYVAAHPDDENTALLAYFAKGKKYRTVYLSLTRGEGGQNILGPEKDADLGIIRTQELLDARRVDGAEQLFSRAVDFGFSKSPVETIALWGRDAVVSDIVWAIRSLRPDVIITRFSPTEGGHGNHTASAILAAEAFAKSGDTSWYHEQLRFVRPWKAKRLFFNRLSFGPVQTAKDPGDQEIDVGAFNPLLGLSYTELAGISRSLHKTQAMGSEQRRGKSPALFRLTAVDSADATAMMPVATHSSGRDRGDDDLLAGIETSWKRFGATEIDRLLSQAERNFDPEHAERILPSLLRASKLMASLASMPAYASDPLLARKRREIVDVITSCIGLNATAVAARQQAVPGEPLTVTVEMIARAGVPMLIRSLSSPMMRIDTVLNVRMQADEKQQVRLTTSIPAAMSPSQPYWLDTLPSALAMRANGKPGIGTDALGAGGYHYLIPAQTLVGLPENPDSLLIFCDLMISGEPIRLMVPVRSLTIDPVAGEIRRPVSILPALDVSCTEKMNVWTSPGVKPVTVRLTSNDGPLTGSVRLVLPSGYHAEPAMRPFASLAKDETRAFAFMVRADSAASSGIIRVEASTQSGALYASHGIDLAYPHIIPQHVMHPAQLKAVRADMNVVKRRIGYIAGSGDEVPEGLHQCGYEVVTIDDDTLLSGSLASFESIVVGVRAYNVRPQVRRSNERLMEYTRNGGTLVVQYQTPGREVEGIGPYPFRISRNRVTDETAVMTEAPSDTSARADSSFLRLRGRLMNVPNRITEEDFAGWVQERGLSFADVWDAQYDAPFLCNDPDEPSHRGSLLVAPYGHGVYCYTGLSFFRQFPAGVSGAFRLFGNLIELEQ